METTCCIAASYEAKACGVKNRTGVREARCLCPGIVFVEAEHSNYVRAHERIKKLIHEIIYVDAVVSIDEMYGRLPPHWQPLEVARAKAMEVKTALATGIGEHIRASIGLAPNRFLAKLASKLEKPNGLTTMDFEEIPEKLYHFKLSDITGIGQRIEQRLYTARIMDMEALCMASRRKLHRIWGGIEGDRMWYALRGVEVPAVETTRRSASGTRMSCLHACEPSTAGTPRFTCKRPAFDCGQWIISLGISRSGSNSASNNDGAQRHIASRRRTAWYWANY